MTHAEQEAGITYAELDIDIGRRSSGNIKTFCPKCHHLRNDKSDKSLSVDLNTGQWLCHYPKCGWHSGLGIEGRERSRDNYGHGSVAPGSNGSYRAGNSVSRSSSPAQNASDANAAPVTSENGQNDRRHLKGISVACTPQGLAPVAYSDPRPLPELLDEWAAVWLGERGIPSDIAVFKFNLRSSTYKDKETGEDKQCLHFPYYVGKMHVNTKHRTLPKQFSQERGTMRSLYNIDSCADASTIVIVEGELDVIACAVAGWDAAVSGPDGAGKGGRTFAAFDEPAGARILGAARWLIIATDADEPGRDYAQALVERFGPSRCRLVEWPEGVKDANEMLVQQGPIALGDLLRRAQPAPLPGLRPLSAHRESVHRRYESGFAPGVSTGWPDFDYKWRPVEGEVVFLSGYPGDGKTSWANHLLTNLAYLNDWNIAIHSPEQGIEGEILGKICSIVADAPYLPNFDKRLTIGALDQVIDWVGDHFYEIHSDKSDAEGFASLTVPQILSIVEPGVVANNIKMLVIDPWNELESSRPQHMSTVEYISSSISTIRSWAKKNRVVVMVVIHPRKPDSVASMAKGTHPYEAADAAHWNNKADVFITVQRIREGDNAGNTIVKVHKHRREGITGEIGAVEFQFKRETGRFYCLGTVIPTEYGVTPYTDLPVDIMFSREESEETSQENFSDVLF